MRTTKRYFSPNTLSLLCAAVLYVGMSMPALADLAVIVNPENPVTALNTGDLQRIYMGRMRMFPDSTQGIETIDHPETSDSFVSFYQTLTHMTPAKLKRQRASYLFSGKGRLPIVKNDDAAVKAYVAQSPAAIGYVQVDQVDDTVKVVATVKVE